MISIQEHFLALYLWSCLLTSTPSKCSFPRPTGHHQPKPQAMKKKNKLPAMISIIPMNETDGYSKLVVYE